MPDQYECNKCNKTFKVYATWYSHMRQKHREPSIPCTHCPERFKTVALRNAHYYRQSASSSEGS